VTRRTPFPQPGDCILCGNERIVLGKIACARIIPHGCPRPRVLGVPAKLLETVGAVGTEKQVDASIAFEILDAVEDDP
jgi:hypothetical protein